MGRWERGETSPQPWSRPKLVEALAVSVEQLLIAPWSHRGTVEVAVVLSGGGRVRRRDILFLTGTALTAPAHQWLIRDVSACTTAASRAREYVEPRNEDPPWLYWVSQADITSCAGERLLRLGQADRAAVLLEEGIALFDKSFVRDRQMHSINLANALAQPGKQRDLDAAAGWGMEAIRLTEGLDSTRSADLLRDLSHQLSPYAKVPAVRDFVERSREFAQA